MKLSAKAKALGKADSKNVANYLQLTRLPAIYYGDEAGMEGAADPFNRATFLGTISTRNCWVPRIWCENGMKIPC